MLHLFEEGQVGQKEVTMAELNNVNVTMLEQVTIEAKTDKSKVGRFHKVDG